MNNPAALNEPIVIRWWSPVLFAAMAGGMGWGIRGQYGHETGAMIAGLLVSLTLVFLFCPTWRSLPAARAIAWGTVAMGIGGTMTYGQTIGLTQNGELIGNWEALRWGMLGLGIKGGLWIGFAGLFLGMGLGGVRYRPLELLVFMVALVGVYLLGMALLNMPYDPAHKRLPLFYFSESWRWFPEGNLKPRREYWGGLLLSLMVACLYTGLRRKDGLAPRLAVLGCLGGLIGFPCGQCLQAFHAWNPDVFHQGIWVRLDPCMNWWNMMETTFGTIMGGVLGLGLWLNRKRIQLNEDPENVCIVPWVEWVMFVIFLVMLVAIEFEENPVVVFFLDIGIVMTVIPVVMISGGRWWPYLMAFPLTLLPIAGKTVTILVYENTEKTLLPPWAGWATFLVLPMTILLYAAIRFVQRANDGEITQAFAGRALLLSTWVYFLLNYAVFRFPWPWAEWTTRTPNGIIFTICAVGLTYCVFANRNTDVAKKS